MNPIDSVEAADLKQGLPRLSPGDTVRVHVRVKESSVKEEIKGKPKETERERVLAHRRPPRSGYVGTERIAGYAQVARAEGFPLERVVWVEVDEVAVAVTTLSSVPPASTSACSVTG